MTKDKLALVWFKRDLRLRDHQPLQLAAQTGHPVLLLFLVEPMLVEDPHYDLRHWRFLLQSVDDINQQLAPFNSKVLVMSVDALSAFQQLNATVRYPGRVQSPGNRVS